jgi:hypothetical protein
LQRQNIYLAKYFLARYFLNASPKCFESVLEIQIEFAAKENAYKIKNTKNVYVKALRFGRLVDCE